MTRRPVEFQLVGEDALLGKIHRVTPGDAPYLHRFFDTSPWSPSGRYLTVLKLPFQDREPSAGDEAEICVIDLQERTLEAVSTTRAWSIQMGAQQQFGADDRFLFYNDMQDGKPVCVKFDLQDREALYMDGPLYQVSPDGSYTVSPDLFDVRRSQGGYGVAVPDEGARKWKPGPDGRALWRTDLESGSCERLVSYDDFVPHLPSTREFRRSALIGFHVKFNVQGDRLLFSLRAMDTKERHGRFKRRPNLFTLKPDGSDIKVALPYSEWSKGGHHPNWHPDGRHCLMNLKLDGSTMSLAEFNYDGTELRALFDDIPGSGHPSYSHDGSFIVTDAYLSDDNVGCGEDTVPLRLIDVRKKDCRIVTQIPVAGAGRGALRCDPHPAWDGEGRRVCFNGVANGLRQVFVTEGLRLDSRP